nr:hypothetical protein CFP56_29496 [Quercus suber]
MNALIKDIEYVSDLGKKIDKKAHQLWDSQQRPGATVQLSDVEKEWISAIEAVVRKTKSCCQNYQRLSRRRQFPRWVYSVFMEFRKISGLCTEIDAVNDEMYDDLFRKCYEIYRLLEGSRALLQPPTRSIEEKLKDLIHGKPDLVRDKKDDIRFNIEFPLKQLLASEWKLKRRRPG